MLMYHAMRSCLSYFIRHVKVETNLLPFSSHMRSLISMSQVFIACGTTEYFGSYFPVEQLSKHTMLVAILSYDVDNVKEQC